MKEFKILVCEDKLSDQQDINLYLDELNQRFDNFVKITIVIKDFCNTIDELKNDYDLLILDFYDGDDRAGDRILNHNRKEIKTVIYTAKAESGQVSFSSLKQKYNYLEGYLSKELTGDNLKEFVTSFMFSNGYIDRYYSLYNDNDIFLQNSIMSIGEHNLNQIFYQLLDQKLISQDVVIYRMTPGLSGAVLLKLKNNNSHSILKLSKETQKLKREHINAITRYNLFPNRLINHISANEIYSFDKSVMGILIKDVDNSKTLFEFILDRDNSIKNISDFFAELYLDSPSLKDHYEKNKGENKNWSYIFNDINSLKWYMIEEIAFKELEPLLSINQSNLIEMKNLVINKAYGSLDVSKFHADKYHKELLLCHRDFHAKNILAQGIKNKPVIIDTGHINYDYWCKDICRLIVSIFINGFDFSCNKYFDIRCIDDNVNMAKLIIERKAIPFDSKNNRVIEAINWLLKNVDVIYGKVFTQFEFQLGLMREFLEVVYRFDTIPPNKRASALLIAYECMIHANDSVLSSN